MLCFSVESRDSLENVEEKWWDEIARHCEGLAPPPSGPCGSLSFQVWVWFDMGRCGEWVLMARSQVGPGGVEM